MLQGVEILSQEVIPIMKSHGWIFFIGLVVAIILGLLFKLLINDDVVGYITYGIIIISWFYSIFIQTQTGEYTQYKVIISDTVNFVEFNDKYEILEQDGEIYTVKERDKNIK